MTSDDIPIGGNLHAHLLPDILLLDCPRHEYDRFGVTHSRVLDVGVVALSDIAVGSGMTRNGTHKLCS